MNPLNLTICQKLMSDRLKKSWNWSITLERIYIIESLKPITSKLHLSSWGIWELESQKARLTAPNFYDCANKVFCLWKTSPVRKSWQASQPTKIGLFSKGFAHIMTNHMQSLTSRGLLGVKPKNSPKMTHSWQKSLEIGGWGSSEFWEPCIIIIKIKLKKVCLQVTECNIIFLDLLIGSSRYNLCNIWSCCYSSQEVTTLFDMWTVKGWRLLAYPA